MYVCVRARARASVCVQMWIVPADLKLAAASLTPNPPSFQPVEMAWASRGAARRHVSGALSSLSPALACAPLRWRPGGGWSARGAHAYNGILIMRNKMKYSHTVYWTCRPTNVPYPRGLSRRVCCAWQQQQHALHHNETKSISILNHMRDSMLYAYQ